MGLGWISTIMRTGRSPMTSHVCDSSESWQNMQLPQFPCENGGHSVDEEQEM